MSFLPAGFLDSGPVQRALVTGAVAAVISAIAGVLTLIRGQSFAGHALTDVSAAGGAAAVLFGAGPLAGFLAGALVGGFGMETVELRRRSERDLVAGIMLGLGLGVSALILGRIVSSGSNGGAPVTILFGSLFILPPGVILPVSICGAVAVVLAALFTRPLLLAALDPDLLTVQGGSPRLMRLVHLTMLALAVAVSSLTVGAILSTAFLIGPAATATRLSARPGRTMALAAILGLIAGWGGILMSYKSYDWTDGHAWPVSFCIVALIVAAHLLLPPVFGRLLKPRQKG
nr:metal ABC transporter permease [Jiella flava]